MQACLSAQGRHNRPSHALLEYVSLTAIVGRAVCQEAEMEWGAPRAGPFGRCRFFRRFSAHFCVTLEHLFFTRQNVKEKSAENLRKNLRKNLRRLVQNLSPKLRPREGGGGEESPVFLKPSKISLHSIPPNPWARE